MHKTGWIFLGILASASPAQAGTADDAVASYFGNTLIVYSRTGAVYRAHHYPDHRFIMERPSGITEGTWRINEKGEFCARQTQPPREQTEHCHRLEPGRKQPGDSWDMAPGDVSHHQELIAGDVFNSPAPESDAMRGYYDNIYAVSGPDNFERKIYFNRDHSALLKGTGGDTWNSWSLKDADRVCLWPRGGDAAQARCHPFVGGKQPGDTWQHTTDGKTYTTRIVAGRP